MSEPVEPLQYILNSIIWVTLNGDFVKEFFFLRNTEFARKPYIFVIFQGGSLPPVPPLDLPMKSFQ